MQIQYEEILRIVTAYIIPILSFIFSGIALYHSNKSRQTEEKLKNFELYIKEHEAKQIESLQNIPSNPNIEARVYKISKGNYKIKIWNSGKATAHNVSASIPEKYNVIIMRDKFPYEYLKPNDSFEANVVYHMGSSSKFEIKTVWENENGDEFSNTELRSI